MQTWDLTEIETPEGSRSPVVLASEDDARAVLIGLHPGQSLGEHQVKEHAWLVVVDGTVELSSGDESVTAGAGTIARFMPNERHALRSEGGAKVLLLLAPWPGEGHYRGNRPEAG